MEPTEGVQALARPNKALRLRRVSSLVFGTWCALFVLVVARVAAEVPADLLKIWIAIFTNFQICFSLWCRNFLN